MQKSEFKTIFTYILVCVFCLVVSLACGGEEKQAPAPSSQPSADRRGEEIVAEFLKRDASPFRKARIRFTVSTADEPQKVCEVDNWRKQSADGTSTLSQIVKPAEDSDLGSLTLEPKDLEATVTTYVPSRGEFRETDTKKMFFGGLTAAELLGEWTKFSYRFIGDKEIGGVKTLEVEGNLKPDADSIISKTNVLFRSDNYFPVEMHFFDSTGREIRIYKITDIRESGGHVYAAKSEVENPVYKAKITIEFLSIEYPATMDDALFKKEKLKTFAKK